MGLSLAYKFYSFKGQIKLKLIKIHRISWGLKLQQLQWFLCKVCFISGFCGFGFFFFNHPIPPPNNLGGYVAIASYLKLAKWKVEVSEVHPKSHNSVSKYGPGLTCSCNEFFFSHVLKAEGLVITTSQLTTKLQDTFESTILLGKEAEAGQTTPWRNFPWEAVGFGDGQYIDQGPWWQNLYTGLRWMRQQRKSSEQHLNSWTSWTMGRFGGKDRKTCSDKGSA